MKRIAILFAIACGAASIASAQNLLLNGSFDAPASGSPPDNWSAWSWNNPGQSGWANHENNPGVSYDGSYYVVAGANSGGGGGFFQTVSATAGTEYKLDVLSGADAWWLPTGTMTMSFLDSSAVQLGTATRNTVDPAVYGNNYDIAHPWAAYSLDAIAPVGTTQVKVEFAANWATGSVWFENASLTTVPEPGTLALAAAGAALLLAHSRRTRRS
jgi:hypothetical protein